ncbi:hypothetical protein Tco_0308529, partial [Tanacetum coccineum]
GNSEDESDDVNDDDNANDDDNGNEVDDGNDAHDIERTDSDGDENPSFTLKDYEKEEEHDEEYVHSPENYESDDDKEDVHEEEDDDLYKDVDVKSLGAEYEKERKGDAEMIDADQMFLKEKSYEQVVEDAHVTLTSSQKTESSKQSSSVSSDFSSKVLILDNVLPVVDEVASMMNVKIRQEESSTQAPSLFTVPKTAIQETSTAHTTTELSQLKQVDHSAQLLESTKSQIPTIVDDLLSTRIGYATRTALQLYTKEFEKKAQEERKLYINVILPKEVSDFATPVIQSTINESLENVVLAKSSSQPKSTYEVAASLTEFELKKILLDKIEKSKSCQAAPKHKELYDGLVKSYNLDKDLFSSYGNIYSLKRDREDEDKDEDPPTGSNQGLKKWKTSKDTEPPKGSKSKESKSSSFKGTKPRPKSSGKSTQVDKPVFEVADTKMQQDQGSRQVVPTDYFFNNDLEYLKGGSSSIKYTTSTTKTKAAKYDNIKGIEDMVPTLWSPVKRRIITVTHVKVMKWYDYGYLEEIIIRRDDQKLYKFMKGDFLRLNLRDIEDLLLLLVQKKLSNLDKDIIFDLNVAL